MTSKNGPTIPTTEFTPRPATAWAGDAQWAVSVRRTGDSHMRTFEVRDLDEVLIADAPIPWRPADDGSGVLYAKLDTIWGATVAIARAVPLS